MGAMTGEHRAAVRMTGAAGAFIASLCCAGPLLPGALGVLSIPAAGALGIAPFYGYWWAFITAGLSVSAATLTVYFRRRGVCTLDQARRRRGEIQNTALAALLVFTVSRDGARVICGLFQKLGEGEVSDGRIVARDERRNWRPLKSSLHLCPRARSVGRGDRSPSAEQPPHR